MTTYIKTRIIKIGNSQGIRIPKAILESCRLSGSVNLEIDDGKIVLSPSETQRIGWEESFKAMAGNGDDTMLLDDAVSPSAEDADWTW